MTGKDILNMKVGQSISCSDFYTSIVHSKIRHSDSWAGEDYIIKNTPQQGINWIGNDNCPKAVIIKSKSLIYLEDSYKKGEETYAFKSRNGYVNKYEKANQVIINQQKFKYPIMYFVQKEIWSGRKYYLVGLYSVKQIFDTYVSLIPFENLSDNAMKKQIIPDIQSQITLDQVK